MNNLINITHTSNMYKKFLVLIILATLFISSTILTCTTSSPYSFIKTLPNTDSIITNNNIKNSTQTLQETTNKIIEDSLNYSFNKEEINNNINSFKIDYINTINSYISSKDYSLALTFLNQYFYLFSNDTQINSLREYLIHEVNNQRYTPYSGEIEVLSFTPLIAYPKQAFSKNNSQSTKLDEEHITTDEFKKILLNLYEKNYILTSPQELINNTQNSQVKPMQLPPNKKPIILMLEDVEYNSKTNGCVDKLIIDRNNKISTYTPKRSINDRIHSDNDFITILEEFVSTHPTFSLNNAKATIIVDGSKGMFGYNTQKTNATSKYEIKKAIEIVNYLKNNGYTFASEGYNTNIQDSPVDFANGLNIWDNEITPIVGSSNVFFLNANIATISGDLSYQSELLNKYGYTLFIGLEMTNKYEFNKNLNGLYLTAKQINGKTLRYSSDIFNHLFDSEKIYDHLNRVITFKS